jgi:hypothetical protein
VDVILSQAGDVVVQMSYLGTGRSIVTTFLTTGRTMTSWLTAAILLGWVRQ